MQSIYGEEEGDLRSSQSMRTTDIFGDDDAGDQMEIDPFSDSDDDDGETEMLEIPI